MLGALQSTFRESALTRKGGDALSREVPTLNITITCTYTQQGQDTKVMSCETDERNHHKTDDATHN
jgi:hypothetical protein